jgi:hypothetical protein
MIWIDVVQDREQKRTLSDSIKSWENSWAAENWRLLKMD